MQLDSRLHGYFGRETHPTLPLERTYCVFCGCPKGWVTTDSMNFIRATQAIVVCNDCDMTLDKRNMVDLHVQEFR